VHILNGSQEEQSVGQTNGRCELLYSFINITALQTKWPYYWWCCLGGAAAGKVIMLEGNVHTYWMSHLPIFKNVCVKALCLL
jgi:hypothetical protein